METNFNLFQASGVKEEKANVFKNVADKIENSPLIDQDKLRKWKDYAKLANKNIFIARRSDND